MRLQDTLGQRFTHMLQGGTCLLRAAIVSNHEAAEVLVAHGADRNIGKLKVSPKPPVASILFVCFRP